MLLLRSWGLIWWTTGFGVICSWFIIRKTCYGWRPLLLEGSASGIYPVLTEHERRFILQPNEEYEAAMVPLSHDQCYGELVREEFLTREETDFVLDEMPSLVKKYGRKLTREQKATMTKELTQCDIDPSFLEEVRFVSDAFEDPREPKGTWGVGDALRMEDLPPVVRRLANRVQENYPTIGMLRHVNIHYSPAGKMYLPIRSPHHFFGHDFVVIPVGREKAEQDQGGVVITVSPNHRSRFSDLREVLQSSWSGKDQDVYTPYRGMLRLYATARFKCGWGVRPLQYFGHPRNALPLDPQTFRSRSEDAPLATPVRDIALQTVFASWVATLVRAIQIMFATLFFRRQEQSTAAAAATDEPVEGGKVTIGETDQALIALYFEGPISETETRNRFRRWEMYAFGEAPTKDTWTWESDDVQPTEEEVGSNIFEVIWWLGRHFWYFGRMGAS